MWIPAPCDTWFGQTCACCWKLWCVGARVPNSMIPSDIINYPKISFDSRWYPWICDDILWSPRISYDTPRYPRIADDILDPRISWDMLWYPTTSSNILGYHWYPTICQDILDIFMWSSWSCFFIGGSSTWLWIFSWRAATPWKQPKRWFYNTMSRRLHVIIPWIRTLTWAFCGIYR